MREGLPEKMTFEKRPTRMRPRIMGSVTWGNAWQTKTPVLRPWRELCLACMRKAHVAGADCTRRRAAGFEARETRGKGKDRW